MDIITKKSKKTNNIDTLLKVVFKEDIGEDFGNVIPYPYKHEIDRFYTYFWLIDGTFRTKKGIEFFNDIVARFLITYKDKIRLTDYKNLQNNGYDRSIKLKQFQNLKSISINIINQTTRFDGTKDMVFWCLKLYSEEVIKERGIIQFDTLFDYGYTNFKDNVKDFSTLKSKCRSIVMYYLNRNYKLDKYERKLTDKELTMTRSQNMIKVNKDKKQKNNEIVKNFLSGLLAINYKKANGKWNMSKISKDLSLSRNTVIRIIKEENL